MAKIKMKTHKGTAKRVKKTAKGKYVHTKAFGAHKLTSKSGKRRRQLRKEKNVHSSQKKLMDNLLPYA